MDIRKKDPTPLLPDACWGAQCCPRLPLRAAERTPGSLAVAERTEERPVCDWWLQRVQAAQGSHPPHQADLEAVNLFYITLSSLKYHVRYSFLQLLVTDHVDGLVQDG